MNKTLDMPVVNNRLAALAKHLGINASVIEQRYTVGDVHTYLHKGTMYFVANIEYGLACDESVEVNDKYYSVLAQKDYAPYIRFYDAKVMHQLRSISPVGYKLIAINQREFKVLFRTETGELVAYRFSSHVPEDITTYYLIGDLTLSLNAIADVFSNSYQIQDSDEALTY